MKGYLSVLLFLGIPTVVWFAVTPLVTADVSSFAFALGGYFGVLGFSLFTLALLLSMRIPAFERIFGNLATAYKFHQWTGTIATVVLLLHPLLLAVPTAMFFPKNLIEFFIPLHSFFQLLGVLALITLVVCIFITFFVSLPYHTWKKTHRYLALAFLLGAVHGFFINGSIAFNPWERVILGLFVILGIIAAVYRIFGKKFIIKKTAYTLTRVETLGSITRLTLRAVEKPMTFKAGQFGYVTIEDPQIKDEHPFSIVSKEGDKDLVFMAKILGDDTALFPTLATGTKVFVEGPYGNFSYALGGKRQLWIAGGIGITPFMSLAASLPNGYYDIDLFYSVKTMADAVGHAELEEMTKTRPGLRVHLWVTEIQGYLTCDAIKQAGIDYGKIDDVLLCGPRAMTLALRDHIIRCGIRPGHIHSELFATRSLNILPRKK